MRTDDLPAAATAAVERTLVTGQAARVAREDGAQLLTGADTVRTAEDVDRTLMEPRAARAPAAPAASAVVPGGCEGEATATGTQTSGAAGAAAPPWLRGCKYNLRRFAQGPSSKFAFQLLDLHIVDWLPERLDYSVAGMTSETFTSRLSINEPRATSCTVCMFACEASGASVMITVTDFQPYLTYEVASRSMVAPLIAHLQELVRCDLVHKLERKKRMHGFVPSREDPTEARAFDFVRVRFPTLRAMMLARKQGHVRGAKLCERKVGINTMFLDVCNVRPSGWFRLRASQLVGARRASHCSLELQTTLAQIEALPERMDMAPLLVASVDIECFSAEGRFPDAKQPGDRIGMICTTFWRVGEPIERTVTVLQCARECAPVEGAIVECFATEREMLDAWRDMMAVHADPDMLIGYYVFGFDFKYMGVRARDANRFWYQSRLVTARCELTESVLQSNALGMNTMITFGSVQRAYLDLLYYIKAEHKLPMYKLDTVAKHFLNEQKVDLPYTELNVCLDGDAEAMARAAFYCRGDTELPLRLLKRLEVVPSVVEMSRITWTTLHDLIFRGQQVKVFSQIVVFAHRNGYVLNDPPEVVSDGKYKGATVLEPKAGYYDTKVITMDFASLYPSIMMAHNLCYSTLVVDAASLDVPGVTYESHALDEKTTATFVRSTEGVLPRILQELLAARSRAKKQMARATTAEEKALLNGRQLALKISCNSVYGFTGAGARGMYPDVAIARTVTFVGRQMIDATAKAAVAFIRSTFAEESTVVYGDTDSVMVHLHNADITPTRAFEMGERTAAHISDLFGEKITLEMEKVTWPFLLMRKKCYVGLTFTPNKKGEIVEDKLDAKGVKTVRRDNCSFARDVYTDVMNPLIRERSPELALRGLAANLERLVRNELTYADYTITKSFKDPDSYANKLQPQLVVAEKIATRSNGLLKLRTEDRVPFFIAEGKDPKVSQRAEDPAWGEQNGVPPDRMYYLQNQIEEAIRMLFEPFPKPVRDELEKIFATARHALERQRHGQMPITAFLEKAAAPAATGAPASSFDAFDRLCESAPARHLPMKRPAPPRKPPARRPR